MMRTVPIRMVSTLAALSSGNASTALGTPGLPPVRPSTGSVLQGHALAATVPEPASPALLALTLANLALHA